MERPMICVATLAASIAISGSAYAAILTDAEWGQTRCDLVSPENSEACMAAHVRLGIPADKTTATAVATSDVKDAPEVAHAKAIVADHMRDPGSVMFKDVVYIKEKLSVCGSVNAKNGYGGYAGYSRFVVGPSGEIETFDGGTDCYGSEKEECYTRKIAGIQAIKENCSTTAERKLADDPKEVRKRVGELGDEDGAMSWVMQDDVMTWIERNQASTDGEIVKAMVSLCDLMSNRGSASSALRLAAVETNAASRKVRHACGAAREEFED